MKRLFALLLLSLTTVAFAGADERQFRKALTEWEALFQPLTTSSGRNLSIAAERVGREALAKEEALNRAASGGRDYEEALKALEKNLAALQAGYDRSAPKDRKTLLRLAAVLADVFFDGSYPMYPTCGTGLAESLTFRARLLFDKWVGSDPKAHFGLLYDPDPRVAEITLARLLTVYPEECRELIFDWHLSPHARFRGIAAVWVRELDPSAQRQVRARLVDDPDKSIRGITLRFYEFVLEETRALFARRLATFGRQTEAQRWTTLTLGTYIDHPDLRRLASQCLRARDVDLRTLAEGIVQAKPGTARE